MTAQNHEYEKIPVVEVGTHDRHRKEPSYGYGVRHVQSLIFFLTLLVGYLARTHLAVSVVAMSYSPSFVHQTINVSEINTDNNISIADQDWDNYTNRLVLDEMENVTSNDNGIYKKYIWAKPIQEMVLTSFYLGYCLTQYFLSMVAQRWGGKLPLQIGLLFNAVVSVATPWFAFWGGWKAVCACRIVQGVSQAGLYPSLQTLLAQWVPPTELGTIGSFVYTGNQLGTVIAFQLGGFLAASPWGWPSVFWGTGILCFITFILLTVFGAATPAEHKSISKEEVMFITYTMPNIEKKKPQVPLKAILTSKPVWAIFATHIGSSIAFLFTLMQVPSYIHYSLGVNVQNSGLFSSVPYVASFFASIFFGVFSDFLTNRNFITVKTARNLFNTFSQIGIALCLVAVTYTKNVTLAIVLLVIAQATQVATHVGWMVNYIDLSSNFSGPLLALGNTLLNGLTLLLPVMVSYIITDVANQSQWRVMFYLMAAIALITNFNFVMFMSVEKQPWDNMEYYKSERDVIDMKKLKPNRSYSTNLI